MRKFIEELKFWQECQRYGMSLWECPRFLFIIMGLVTIFGMIITSLIAQRYGDPEFVIISVSAITVLIFSVGHMVVQSFEKVAMANRMKTEFVSIASHQLRSPLSALKWSLNLLLSGRLGKLEGKQLEYAEIIREGNERMIKLVNDLLNVSRIDEGRIILNKEYLDLPELIQGITREVKSYALANNVEIHFEGKDSALKVFADKQYIEMVLGNLVDNAIRYIPQKGKVTLVLKKVNNRFARVEVKDNGVGIPEEEQKNIFHKFFRSRNALRHRTEGSGLGLYVAKSFIEMHGGKISFTSQEGKGTTFWFDLPLIQGKPDSK
jgi:signal transduction histidine kinase